MSKELNKAPVEQAGGDERAAFEYWASDEGLYPKAVERAGNCYKLAQTQSYWMAWQARAALAQPSPVRSSLLINGYQLRAALDFIAPDGTAEQLESEACIEWRQQDADFLEAGLYAFCAEYPEEGGVLLDEEPTTAQPSPLQSEQAEAERPEVVASVVHSNPVVLGQCGPLNANDELMTVAQHAASVARWAEMFNRVEQQRDAALVEVERLRESKGDPVGSLEKCMKVMYERDEHAKRLEAALARVAELEKKLAMALDAASKGDAARQAAGGMEMEIEELRAELAELRARVAVVPDGYALVPVEPTREMFIAINKENDKAYAGGCHHGAQFEWLWAAAIEAAPRPNGLTVSESALDTLRKAASGEVKHLNNGLCPDDIDGHEARDPDCPVCRALLDTESNNV